MAGLQPILPAVNMAFFGLAGASLRLVSSGAPAQPVGVMDSCESGLLLCLSEQDHGHASPAAESR